MRAETGLLTTNALGRCVNALSQLGSAASLVHSFGFLAMPDAGPSCAGGEARSFAHGDLQHAQQAVHAAMHAHGAAAIPVAQSVQAGSQATATAVPHATQHMAPPAQQVAPQALEQAPHPHTAQQTQQDAQTDGPASPLWMLADVSQGGDTSRSADSAGQPSSAPGAAPLAPPPRPPPVRAVPVSATLRRSAVCNVANGTATSAESAMATTSAAGSSVPAQSATQQSPAWPFGHSPGFSEVAHYLQNNSPRRTIHRRTPTFRALCCPDCAAPTGMLACAQLFVVTIDILHVAQFARSAPGEAAAGTYLAHTPSQVLELTGGALCLAAGVSEGWGSTAARFARRHRPRASEQYPSTRRHHRPCCSPLSCNPDEAPHLYRADATSSSASWTAGANAPASAHPPPGFSQFKRRQTCLPSNLIPSNLKV